MAKRVDPLKAKEAKQKKIAAVGGVLLLALMGVQGPKTLKMLQGPQPVSTASATTPVTTGGVPTPAPPVGGDGSAPAAPAGPTADLASVADSDLSPVIEPGQLATFERFSSKDPFVQQGEPAAAPGASSAGGGAAGGGATPAGGGADPASPPDDGAAAPTPAVPGGFTIGGSDGGGTAPPAAPSAPPVAVAEATTIAVNGLAEDVAVEGAFPKDEPTFVLVSVAANGKSVELGIAGGEYAGGDETLTLKLGETITLQNTADGSRYELELRSIQGFPLPKKKTKS